MIFFDHNSTSPLCPAAREAWLEATERFYGNPSSQHRLGARAERALEEARGRLARRLGCGAHEIVWTSGATEAANTVAHHFASTSPGEAWVSALEHPCVLEPVRRWFAGRIRWLPVAPDGVTEIGDLQEALCSHRPAFVSVMAVNNETGIVQPWREALALCREAGVPFFCDAAQWIGKLPAAGLGSCDWLSGCAHKFGGPQGVGFLKCSGPVQPLLVGGPQEEGRRAGTENVAGVLAMVAALEAREEAMPGLGERVRWRDEFIRGLPGATVLGLGRERLWNTVSAIMPPTEGCARWVVKLDKHGAAVSTGSACASGKEQISHVLSAMGLEAEEAARVIRFSSGWETTSADWERLREIVALAGDDLR